MYRYTEDDSPYPEVRAAVANTDDTSIPVGTFRAWLIGIAWAILIPGLNQFFFFRFPSVSVGGVSGLPTAQISVTNTSECRLSLS